MSVLNRIRARNVAIDALGLALVPLGVNQWIEVNDENLFSQRLRTFCLKGLDFMKDRACLPEEPKKTISFGSSGSSAAEV